MKTTKTKKKAADVRYTISLPGALLRRLDAIVARKDSSRSRETRDALKAHLKREKETP